MPGKRTQTEFIELAAKIHNSKYDYSKVNYFNSHIEICIICPIHGEFWQKPVLHLGIGRKKSYGCPICGGTVKSNNNDFILKAKEIHGHKYDYSLVDYKNNKTKVKIICPNHGIFEQRPNNHLSLKQGCPKCRDDLNGVNKRKSINEYIKLANSVHNNRYDYSLVKLNQVGDKVKIICPIHGVFEQFFNNHLCGFGCKKCSNNISAGERQLLDYIKSIYDGLILENDRKILDGKELDIYLPELKLAIEYNGEYWHNLREEFQPGYHKLKDNLCKEKGIKLINVSDKSWTKNPDKVKEKIQKLINE